MTNTLASTQIAASEPWAEVRTTARVMRYRRSGAGPTVLLLGADAGPTPLASDLVEALGLRFRVIVPDVPIGPFAVSWLAEFLDGLGSCQVAIMAANHQCMAAIELAFREPERVTRMVLVPDGEPDDNTTEGALQTSVGEARVPVLIVRPGLAAVEAEPLVTNFLAGA